MGGRECGVERRGGDEESAGKPFMEGRGLFRVTSGLGCLARDLFEVLAWLVFCIARFIPCSDRVLLRACVGRYSWSRGTITSGATPTAWLTSSPTWPLWRSRPRLGCCTEILPLLLCCVRILQGSALVIRLRVLPNSKPTSPPPTPCLALLKSVPARGCTSLN